MQIGVQFDRERVHDTDAADHLAGVEVFRPDFRAIGRSGGRNDQGVPERKPVQI
jgi:alpha/beta superfamily hydrolase